MNADEVFNFLFGSFGGLGCLVAIGLVISFIACIIMEKRTRKQFVDRAPSEDDWSFFDDDDEEGDEAKSKD